jgi:hypothetical protein
LKSAWARAHLTHALVRSASGEREHEHEVETLFRLGRGLHAEKVPTRDVARLRRLVIGPEAPGHGRVVIQLTAKLERLGVPGPALRAALRTLAHTVPCIGVAAPGEEGFARDVGAATGLDVEVTDSMEHWKALLAGARAVVAPDSGAAHVAGMTGVGCVDLFADAPDVGRAMGRWYPWAARRTWVIPATRRVAEQFADQVLAGVDYVAAPASKEAVTA